LQGTTFAEESPEPKWCSPSCRCIDTPFTSSEWDEQAREIETEEKGGVIRRWHHVLRVEPRSDGSSHYSDTVHVDAGALTPVVAFFGTNLYRYRQPLAAPRPAALQDQQAA
jgi:hypothetical protein